MSRRLRLRRDWHRQRESRDACCGGIIRGVLIAGYENDPLVDGAPFLMESLFWPTYLVSTVAIYDDTMVNAAFGVDHEDVMSYYRRLTNKSRWPVFRIGLRDGHEIDVIYRNLDGDMGIDFVLCRTGGEHPLHLAALEGHHSGPGLSWPELVAGATFPDVSYGVVEPDARLLLLLPAFGDADPPETAAVMVATALASRGARSGAAALAEALLADSELWPRWRRQSDGVLVCNGRYSRRNPEARGGFPPDDLREISSALPVG